MHAQLVRRALAARRSSYSPYSRFRVGAALLTTRGNIYTGCNVEISSYSLTCCAERVALFKAIAAGQRSFTAMAIASDSEAFTSPCGACRQVIWELAGNIRIILVTTQGRTRVLRAASLLPHPFGPRDLPAGDLDRS